MKVSILKMFSTDFKGDPNLGLYGFASDKSCILGPKLGKNTKAMIKKVLKVRIHECSVLETDFAGMFLAGNSKGIIASDIIKNYEYNSLQKISSVCILKTNYTTAGNLILMNDKGIVLSPLLKKFKQQLSDFFKIPCESSKIAGINIIGSLGIATNKGCLLHPKVKKKELKIIEKTLGITTEIGTVNYGSPYPGSGIIANSFGFIASKTSSGPELGRINEALRFL